MSDPLNPSLGLLSKLGSIVVHADEAMSEEGHQFDVLAIKTCLDDPEVQQWIKDMGVYLPKKR